MKHCAILLFLLCAIGCSTGERATEETGSTSDAVTIFDAGPTYPAFCFDFCGLKRDASLPEVVPLAPYFADRLHPSQATWIAVGDSITAGGGSYPIMVGWKLGTKVKSINDGISGITAREELDRIDAAIGGVLPADAGIHVVSILLGVNDAFHEDAGIDLIVSRLHAYVAAAHARGWKVVQITPPPPQGPSFGAKYPAFVAAMLADCTDSGAEGCVDLSTDQQLTTFSVDGIHPSGDDGRQRIAEIVAPVLRRVFLDAGLVP